MDSLQKIIHLYEMYQHQQVEMQRSLRRTFSALSKVDLMHLLREFEQLIHKREHVMHMLTFQEKQLGVSLSHQGGPILKQIEMLRFFLQIGRDVLEHETSQ
ncbi:hypothetical protein CN918_25550 [Priestia megaterium]|nr:hypothetical protein CN918_25550 [Priestia megaterium]